MTVQHIPMPGTEADGSPKLPMAGRVAGWARRAGLALRWEAVPFKRSLQDLQRNAAPLCVLGVFDTPERRHFAKFSLPIFQEEQQVFIAASRAAPTLRAQPGAHAAILSPKLQLLVYDGVGYGTVLDAWIAERRPPPVRATAGTSNLATMLSRGHADFTIATLAALQELQVRG
ncbi:MAG: transporter substrate-binding domain-containing protein [Burkholderiales bacterium]|nr:MAG: transporter substrate-binding domain-containing protein [Burkholderiales bacterium]